jgi:phage I-like protein
MAKALALHPWFKEVRAYEFLRHLLDLQGTAEDKAIAAGLFSSSRALADWTELCGGRRSITKDYMGSNASATQQSGGAGGNGSADEASSTRSDASSDGDAWFRSIK